jgi:hypothetical protein
MDDLITLGVEVQTTGGAQAAQGLGAFQKAAQGAAGAADQLENKVNALGAAQNKSAAPAKAMASAVGGVGAAFKNNSSSIQNASFQLQDIIVQMEMGVPIARTLGQQLPQLLGGFGPLGAVIGLATGALLSFGPALFAAGEPVNDLADSIKELEAAMSALQASANQSLSTADLTKTYGAQVEAARELLVIERQLAQINADKAFSSATSSVVQGLGQELAALNFSTALENVLNLNKALADQATLRGQIAEVQAGTSTLNDEEITALEVRKAANEDLFMQLNEYRLGLRELAATFGVTEQTAGNLVVAMAAVTEADTTEQRVEATKRLTVMIAEVTNGLKTASPAGLELYQALLDAAKAGIQLQALDLGTQMDSAASGASRLADELSRAVGNAASLASQSIAARTQAEIKLQYKDDPVGAARALAESRFSSTVAPVMQGAPPEVQRVLRGFQLTYVENEVAAAEAAKALADFNKEVKGGASGAKAAASDIKRYYDATRTDAEKYAAGLSEIGALYASGAMDADLYARSVEELTLKFDPLGQLISDLAGTVENELNNAFASVLDGTKSLGEALLDFASNVLAKVAQDLFAQQFATPIASGLTSILGGVAGGLAGAPITSPRPMPRPFEDGGIFDQSGVTPFAKGGVFEQQDPTPFAKGGVFEQQDPTPFAKGGVFEQQDPTPFAKGGIVSGPTIFPFANGTGLMGEAGPEAIMPLSRGSDGKLGVAAANGNSAPKITINNYSGQEASTSSDNMGNIIVEIGRAIAQDITGGGPTYRAIKSTFGISNRLQQRG